MSTSPWNNDDDNHNDWIPISKTSTPENNHKKGHIHKERLATSGRPSSFQKNVEQELFFKFLHIFLQNSLQRIFFSSYHVLYLTIAIYILYANLIFHYVSVIFLFGIVTISYLYLYYYNTTPDTKGVIEDIQRLLLISISIIPTLFHIWKIQYTVSIFDPSYTVVLFGIQCFGCCIQKIQNPSRNYAMDALFLTCFMTSFSFSSGNLLLKLMLVFEYGILLLPHSSFYGNVVRPALRKSIGDLLEKEVLADEDLILYGLSLFFQRRTARREEESRSEISSTYRDGNDENQDPQPISSIPSQNQSSNTTATPLRRRNTLQEPHSTPIPPPRRRNTFPSSPSQPPTILKTTHELLQSIPFPTLMRYRTHFEHLLSPPLANNSWEPWIYFWVLRLPTLSVFLWKWNYVLVPMSMVEMCDLWKWYQTKDDDAIPWDDVLPDRYIPVLLKYRSILQYWTQTEVYTKTLQRGVDVLYTTSNWIQVYQSSSLTLSYLSSDNVVMSSIQILGLCLRNTDYLRQIGAIRSNEPLVNHVVSVLNNLFWNVDMTQLRAQEEKEDESNNNSLSMMVELLMQLQKFIPRSPLLENGEASDAIRNDEEEKEEEKLEDSSPSNGGDDSNWHTLDQTSVDQVASPSHQSETSEPVKNGGEEKEEVTREDSSSSNGGDDSSSVWHTLDQTTSVVPVALSSHQTETSEPALNGEEVKEEVTQEDPLSFNGGDDSNWHTLDQTSGVPAASSSYQKDSIEEKHDDTIQETDTSQSMRIDHGGNNDDDDDEWEELTPNEKPKHWSGATSIRSIATQEKEHLTHVPNPNPPLPEEEDNNLLPWIGGGLALLGVVAGGLALSAMNQKDDHRPRQRSTVEIQVLDEDYTEE